MDGSTSYHDRTLRAIRRIIRAVDIFSRKLEGLRGVTVPQLSCLQHVVRTGPVPLTTLAKEADLSASTTVGIIDRLERKGLVSRARSAADRRQVLISATREGLAIASAAPSPLQDRLASALDALPDLEQAAITLSLERIVDLMGIGEVDAAPILETGVSLAADRSDVGGHDRRPDVTPIRRYRR